MFFIISSKRENVLEICDSKKDAIEKIEECAKAVAFPKYKEFPNYDPYDDTMSNGFFIRKVTNEKYEVIKKYTVLVEGYIWNGSEQKEEVYSNITIEEMEIQKKKKTMSLIDELKIHPMFDKVKEANLSN